MKIYLSDILQGSSVAAMGRPSAQVDVDGLTCILFVCEESVFAEHVHHALIVKKNPVWIKASRVIIHGVRYLMKARAWRGFGVVFVSFVGLRFVFCFSVAVVCFVVDVHT